MKIALITFFCSLLIILVTIVAGIGTVINGPLNVQEFFVESIQSEFNVWSRQLVKVGDGEYHSDKRSCPDDLRQFLERFGILSVRVSQAECSVDWLLDGNFRVRVHYICSPSDGNRWQTGINSWMFKLEDESTSTEALLSILKARRNKCKTWIMILCLSLCVIVSLYFLKVFQRIRQMIPDFAWLVVMYIVWGVDMFLAGLAGMTVWISLMEWMK